MPSKKTFLWKITPPGSVQDSFLFGTMHVQDIRAFERLDEVKAAIDLCDTFAVEFHLDEAAGLAMGLSMQIPDNQELSDLIPPKKYNKLRRVIQKSTGLDIHYFQRVLPLMLTGLLAGQILKKDMPESLDEHLWGYARKQNKVLLGIETLDEQLQVLDNISLDQQVKMLLDLGRNISRFREYTLHTAELYRKGELQELSRSVKRNARGLRHIMLYRRNEIMAERIFNIAQQRSLFAAVGAGHLGGGKGVIRLLKMKGAKVRGVG